MEKPLESILPEGYGLNSGGYLWFVLPVEKFAALPQSIEFEGQTLNKKSEFHVTVINGRCVARELAGADPEAAMKIETHFQELLRDYVRERPMAFGVFTGDLRLAIGNDRESIAARCTLENIEGFFERIQSEYGVLLPTQPTHVSLYTRTGAAVGIDTEEQMESFKKVELPEVANALIVQS